MVRGPAALLGLPLVALAYFLAAGAIPAVGHGDTAVVVDSATGIVAVAVVVLCVAWGASGAEIPLALVALLAGGALLVVATMDGSGAGASASMPEAVLAAAVGVLLARALLVGAGPLGALVIPVVVALVDVWSVAAGPSSRLAHGEPRGASELSIDLPAWGGALHGPISRLGVVDALFLAAFAACALRLGLRARAAAIGMVAGLLATMALSVHHDKALPALPLVAVGFLLPNLDRLGRMVRRPA